eukprot:3690482-Pleurochrysis_carterae.AAC.1
MFRRDCECEPHANEGATSMGIMQQTDHYPSDLFAALFALWRACFSPDDFVKACGRKQRVGRPTSELVHVVLRVEEIAPGSNMRARARKCMHGTCASLNRGKLHASASAC